MYQSQAKEFCRAQRAIAQSPIGDLLSRDPANTNTCNTSFLCWVDLKNDSEGCVSRNVASGIDDSESGSLNESSGGILLSNTVEENLADLENMPITDQRWKTHHRPNPKKTCGWTKRSRKKRQTLQTHV